jgi:hypothetical protein
MIIGGDSDDAADVEEVPAMVQGDKKDGKKHGQKLASIKKEGGAPKRKKTQKQKKAGHVTAAVTKLVTFDDDSLTRPDRLRRQKLDCAGEFFPFEDDGDDDNDDLMGDAWSSLSSSFEGNSGDDARDGTSLAPSSKMLVLRKLVQAKTGSGEKVHCHIYAHIYTHLPLLFFVPQLLPPSQLHSTTS